MLCKGLDIKLTMLLVENLMEQEVILVYSRALHNAAFGPWKMQCCAKSALFKFQYFPTLIQGFSTVQVILSALIQEFSSV